MVADIAPPLFRISGSAPVTGKTIIAKPLDSKFSNEEKQEILTWRNTLLRQVKTYIDNNLISVKVNVDRSNQRQFYSATELS